MTITNQQIEDILALEKGSRPHSLPALLAELLRLRKVEEAATKLWECIGRVSQLSGMSVMDAALEANKRYAELWDAFGEYHDAALQERDK